MFSPFHVKTIARPLVGRIKARRNAVRATPSTAFVAPLARNASTEDSARYCQRIVPNTNIVVSDIDMNYKGSLKSVTNSCVLTIATFLQSRPLANIWYDAPRRWTNARSDAVRAIMSIPRVHRFVLCPTTVCPYLCVNWCMHALGLPSITVQTGTWHLNLKIDCGCSVVLWPRWEQATRGETYYCIHVIGTGRGHMWGGLSYSVVRWFWKVRLVCDLHAQAMHEHRHTPGLYFITLLIPCVNHRLLVYVLHTGWLMNIRLLVPHFKTHEIPCVHHRLLIYVAYHWLVLLYIHRASLVRTPSLKPFVMCMTDFALRTHSAMRIAELKNTLREVPHPRCDQCLTSSRISSLLFIGNAETFVCTLSPSSSSVKHIAETVGNEVLGAIRVRWFSK